MSRPKTALLSQNRLQFEIEKDCPLNDSNLPMVSELEHKTGRCFCHHCSCGRHSCGLFIKKSFSGSLKMRTFYNSEFTKKLSRKELPFMPKEYKSFFKTSLKTNTKSITQSDFVSQKIIKTESCRPDKSFVSVKFSGRSSYERDFIE